MSDAAGVLEPYAVVCSRRLYSLCVVKLRLGQSIILTGIIHSKRLLECWMMSVSVIVSFRSQILLLQHFLTRHHHQPTVSRERLTTAANYDQDEY
eukprot:COSAG05_NODE_8604_length_689_cov_0.781356_1_plen_94_part_10